MYKYILIFTINIEKYYSKALAALKWIQVDGKAEVIKVRKLFLCIYLIEREG